MTRQGRAQTLQPLATEYQGNPGNRPHIHNNHLGFAMHVPTLTDEELRRLIDTEPDNLGALREASHRFVGGSAEEANRVQEFDELESELRSKEEDLEISETMLDTMTAHRDRLQKELDDLKARIRELADA